MEENVTKKKEEVNQFKEKLLENEQSLEEKQKKLRQKMLASKPDENLKNSLLAELYLINS
ncbi:hypothetical protein [uncultured Tenacibaculum sp.]|uniref:hypothetical protein n=1 Tax=uncultured Tenacibaculum sp. TaxID=174713 RepID=UPI0026139124|nr:hypothetical protein [uncultured Tenacibaculum sp.]